MYTLVFHFSEKRLPSVGVYSKSVTGSSVQSLSDTLGGSVRGDVQIGAIQDYRQHVGNEERQSRDDVREAESCYEVTVILALRKHAYGIHSSFSDMENDALEHFDIFLSFCSKYRLWQELHVRTFLASRC